MEIKEMQELIVQVYNQYHPKRTKHQRFITLIEEIGELAESILVHEGCHLGDRPDCLEEEFGDVFSNLMYLAYEYGVDIEESIKLKLQIH